MRAMEIFEVSLSTQIIDHMKAEIPLFPHLSLRNQNSLN